MRLCTSPHSRRKYCTWIRTKFNSVIHYLYPLLLSRVAGSFSKLTPQTGDLYRVYLSWLAGTSRQVLPKTFRLHDNANHKHNAQKVFFTRHLMVQSFTITLHMNRGWIIRLLTSMSHINVIIIWSKMGSHSGKQECPQVTPVLAQVRSGSFCCTSCIVLEKVTN